MRLATHSWKQFDSSALGACARSMKKETAESGIWIGSLDWPDPLERLTAVRSELFKRMDAERDNLWAALEFCLSEPGLAPRGGEFAQHLVAYWTCRGSFGDVRRLLTSLAERVPEDSAPRAQLLLAAAVMANSQNDFEASASLGRE